MGEESSEAGGAGDATRGAEGSFGDGDVEGLRGVGP